MTLNTFHSAGISAKNVTLGVPRLKEIINIATTIKTPSLTIYLQKGEQQNTDIMRAVQTKIEHLTLAQVVKKSEIYYDPVASDTIIPEDQSLVELYFMIPDLYNANQNYSPWMLRMVLDRDILDGHRIEIVDIAKKVRSMFGASVQVINSDTNDEQ